MLRDDSGASVRIYTKNPGPFSLVTIIGDLEAVELAVGHIHGVLQRATKYYRKMYSGGKNKSEKPDFPNEMAFFKWSWQRVKVLPRPWASKSKLSMIRPLKWGTLLLLTPTGFKMASRQSWKNEKTSVLLVKQTFSLIFQLWRLAILKPFGVQRRNVPHFKGLIMLNLDFGAQGRINLEDSPFNPIFLNCMYVLLANEVHYVYELQLVSKWPAVKVGRRKKRPFY